MGAEDGRLPHPTAAAATGPRRGRAGPSTVTMFVGPSPGSPPRVYCAMGWPTRGLSEGRTYKRNFAMHAWGPMVLTLFSRPGCHLCDDMKAIVARVVRSRPEVSIEEVDISTDPALEAQYGTEI